MSEKTTVILGAGPAGMGAAFELHKESHPVLIVEKEAAVGGLSKTLQHGDFRTDIGPHRFFSQNRYLYDMIGDLLGDRWGAVDRLTRFYIDGKFFLYPVRFGNVIANLGPLQVLRVLRDYSLERVKRMARGGRKFASFEEQVVSDFGRALAELNMLNYTEKIWGMPCSEISTDWTKQRIKDLSVMEVVRKMLLHSRKGAKSLVDRFFYPDTGAGLVFERMRDRVLSRSNAALLLESRPVRIRHEGKRLSALTLAMPQGQADVTLSGHLLSTIPITEFVRLLEPAAPPAVLDAAAHLRFRSHTTLFLTVDKTSVFPDQWIYLPDRDIPFGRITEPRNFSAKMAPEGMTSLLIEFFCWENDALWTASRERLLDLALPWLERCGFMARRDVRDAYVHREKYAYPVYDLEYQKHLRVVKEYLGGFENLICSGRCGAFRYNNQDHALEMGILSARSIIEGRRYNIEEVGSQQDYFERGYVSS